MGKPTAMFVALTENLEAVQDFVCKEDNNILDFPVAKYCPGSELVLRKKYRSIRSIGLIQYLQELGIPLEFAKYYCYEVHVCNKQTREKHIALGFQNENDGFELVNPFFKGTIGSQTISFIRGAKPNPESIHVFKEGLDFLSFLSKIGGKKILADIIILHSNLCINQINPYIHQLGYKKVYTWMDNDSIGSEAIEYIKSLAKSEENVKHKSMNFLYKPYKNVQTWYLQRIVKLGKRK